MKKSFSLLPLAFVLAACGSTDTPAPAANVPTESASLDQPEQPVPPQSAEALFSARLDAVLAGDWRPASDKARDAYRHPRETLAFFEVQPGMTVVEITPGGGWYAAVLAPWLKDDGHYIAAVQKSSKPESEATRNETALQKLFAAHPDEFGAAATVEFDPHAPVFGAPDSADRVLTFRNVHNWVMGDYAPAMFKGFFDVLKPGGVLGVVDHRATPGDDLDKVRGSGYLPVDYVVKLATDAGFVLDGQSEVNANPRDDHHHEKGVWTLPPTLALGDKDRDKYLAIGESDRMTLRFVKPLPDEIKATGMDDAPPVPQP